MLKNRGDVFFVIYCMLAFAGIYKKGCNFLGMPEIPDDLKRAQTFKHIGSKYTLRFTQTFNFSCYFVKLTIQFSMKKVC